MSVYLVCYSLILTVPGTAGGTKVRMNAQANVNITIASNVSTNYRNGLFLSPRSAILLLIPIPERTPVAGIIIYAYHVLLANYMAFCEA